MRGPRSARWCGTSRPPRRPAGSRRRIPREVAQQIWSALHGAVALELKDLVLTPDAETTYRATVDMVLRGLAA